MFKKFFASALAALVIMGVGAFTEAEQVEQENQCCRGGYYCASNYDAYDDCCDGGYYGYHGCRR